MSDVQKTSDPPPEEPKEPVKRKRGRPKKVELDPSEQKRHRGRPKGSKNKNPPKVKIVESKPKRPPGRPRKVKPEEKEPVSPEHSKDPSDGSTTR